MSEEEFERLDAECQPKRWFPYLRKRYAEKRKPRCGRTKRHEQRLLATLGPSRDRGGR